MSVHAAEDAVSTDDMKSESCAKEDELQMCIRLFGRCMQPHIHVNKTFAILQRAMLTMHLPEFDPVRNPLYELFQMHYQNELFQGSLPDKHLLSVGLPAIDDIDAKFQAALYVQDAENKKDYVLSTTCDGAQTVKTVGHKRRRVEFQPYSPDEEHRRQIFQKCIGKSKL